MFYGPAKAEERGCKTETSSSKDRSAGTGDWQHVAGKVLRYGGTLWKGTVELAGKEGRWGSEDVPSRTTGLLMDCWGGKERRQLSPLGVTVEIS